jgi:toxin secretion/phage lysis holin
MPAQNTATELKIAIVGFFAVFTAFWGYVGWTIILMIICVALDYVTGSAAAKKTGTWSSNIAREGLWHKAGEFVALLGALLLDFFLWVISQTEAAAAFSPIGTWKFYVSLLVSVWYIITELGSIVENAVAMGAKVPKWLTKGLAKLHDQADNLDPFTSDEDKPKVGASDAYTPQHVKKD